MKILISYFSHGGHTAALADHIARGVEVEGGDAMLRRTADSCGDLPLLQAADFAAADGVALGSACHFGGMAGSLKTAIDATSDLWVQQALRDKPFIVFTSADALHSGLESTLISMAIPLLHHGMIYLGAPLDAPELGRGAGSIYGAHQHAAGSSNPNPQRDEGALAMASGRRLCRAAAALKNL